MKPEFKKLEIKKIQAPNFVMSPAELRDYIDFEPKRVYFISKPTGPTGQHCHLTEKELFIIVSGSCTAVIDFGEGKQDIKLEAPTSAIYVGNYVWHGFKDFSEDAIVLAISSTNYAADRGDYIEDYDKYRETLQKMKTA